MKSFSGAALLILAWATSAWAQEQIFEYKIDFYPVTNEACPVAARSMGEKFTQATGLLVLQTNCQPHVTGYQDLVITYAAKNPVTQVSTFDRLSHEQGFYATAASCAVSLNAETENFRQYTGLAPLAAYCYRPQDTRKDYQNPYILRVEAVGEARLKPINFEQFIYAKPLEPGAVIAERLRQSAAAKGLVWPRVLVDSTGDLQRIVLRYYGARARPIAFLQPTSYPTPGECQARMAEVRNTLLAVDAEPMTMFCARKQSGGLSLLYAVVYVQGTYEVKRFPASYESMSVCDDDKERILDWHRRAQGLDTVGALCSYEQGDILRPQGIFMDIFVRT